MLLAYPKGYFESIDDRLLEKIPFKEHRQKENWIDYLVYQLQLRFSIPALSVVLLVACVLYINLEVEFTNPILMNDDEITDYLVEVYDDDLELEIYSMGIAQNEENRDMLFSDEEIINYLYEEFTEEEIIELMPN